MEQALSYTAALTVGSIGVFTDTRYGLIPNKLTLTALALGLALHAVLGGWAGFIFAAQGVALGLGLFLIPFLIGGMGAGDVKLLAALGAFIGPSHIFVTFLFSVFLGGVMGLVVLIRTFGLRETFVTLFHSWNMLLSPAWRTTRLTGFPFASAILFGVLVSLVVVW